MASLCYGSIKGLVMRATRLNDTGVPQTGATASAVTSGFITLSFDANIETGEEFIVKTANGALCVNEKDCDQLKGLDLTVDLCQVDPELFELLGGVRLIDNGFTTPTSVGYAMGEDLRCSGGFALEVWTRQPGLGGLVYWLFPWIANGIVGGSITIENGPVTFQLTGRTKGNPNWGSGPFDVVGQPPDGSTAGPLVDPVGATEHYLVQSTDVAPPTAQCGYVAVP